MCTSTNSPHFYVYVSACACVYVCYVQVQVHLCTHVWKLMDNLGYHPQEHSPPLLRQGLSLSWSSPVSLSGHQAAGMHQSLPPYTGTARICHHTQLFTLVWDSGDGTQVLTSTLLTELPSLPQFWFHGF